MGNYQIIGLCGRLQSGKSTIANICEEFGYERIYFAQPLKQLCADLLNVDIKTDMVLIIISPIII